MCKPDSSLMVINMQIEAYLKKAPVQQIYMFIYGEPFMHRNSSGAVNVRELVNNWIGQY